MAITDIIMDNLIWILAGIAGVIVLLMVFLREDKSAIENEVDVFFKGGTEESFPCTIAMNAVSFKIGEAEYNEPILHHPRVKYDKIKHKFYRSYKYAEGIGMVEVPPLMEEDKRKIVETLVKNKVIPKNKQHDNFDDYTEKELIQWVKFYNFDIEQITDKPMSNAFVMVVNMFTSMTTALISAVGSDMMNRGTSNLARVAWVIVGILMGFGFAWALTLKGVI
jgi:uncharacterized membrane protein YuzA (DUF378 family)